MISICILGVSAEVIEIEACDAERMMAPCYVEETLVLTEDLDCFEMMEDDACLIIFEEDDDVTIDCDGHSIKGDGWGIGIYVGGNSGVTIKNCDISEFGTGIYAENAEGLLIQDNSLTDNVELETGLHLYNVIDSTIIGNEISSNEFGVIMSSCEGNILEDNSIMGNSYLGVYMEYSDDNILEDNSIMDNFYSGIYMEDSDDNTITGGEIGNNNQDCGGFCDNGEAGIVLTGEGGSDYNTISNVYLHDNSNGAIYMQYSEENIIDGNNINNNCGDERQIYMEYSDDNIIQNNNITEGSGHGIYMSSCSRNQVLNNDISDNAWSGIYIMGDEGEYSDHIIQGNDLMFNNYNGYSGAIELWSEYNVFIDNNNILNNYYTGIYTYSTSETTISNNRIEGNCEGVNLQYSDAVIEDTDFIDNHCEGGEFDKTGIYMYDSTVWLTNSDFINNGYWGICEDCEGMETIEPPPIFTSVYWTITDEVTCQDNDLYFYSGELDYPIFEGGKLIKENCDIYIDGELWEISSGATGYEKYGLNIENGTETNLDGSVFEIDAVGNENQNLELTVEQYDENPGPGGYALEALGKYFRFEVDDELNVDWMIIKIYYNPDELNGLSPSTLALQYYDEDEAEWVTPEGGVNTDENYVWAKVTHFSIWGVFGSTPSPPPSSGGGGGSTRCNPYWKCTQTECQPSSTLTESCKDLTDCEKPTTKIKSCIYEGPVEEPEEIKEPEVEESPESPQRLFGITGAAIGARAKTIGVGILVALVLVGAGFMILNKK